MSEEKPIIRLGKNGKRIGRPPKTLEQLALRVAGNPDYKREPSERHFQVADHFLLHGDMKEALKAASYGIGTTQHPSIVFARIPGIYEAIKRRLMAKVGTVEDDSGVIRGRLMNIITMGKDGDAINAAYRAGQDKRLNLFVPETQVGIFNMIETGQIPEEVKELMGMSKSRETEKENV